ncbi:MULTISPECIES: PAS domain S-box protein [unclassified Duganella]|uniref:PAS domain S-box protein n=1 Tax=unclassified Duganella TaxID=2636909 RepID=UPI000884DC6E|nr:MULTISPECIES: PAS domain S-box protein [unclassified Duganella]SDF78767.1 PAS domain S-box-containing protein/diguanylate cyclase (GGDEF) domain-containing protein [Duganella sp. OV458]SDI50311.1 sensor protein [Duganella sp. OV510]
MAVFATLPRSLKFRMTGVVVMLVLTATLIVTLVALLLVERDMRSVIGNQQYALLSSAAAQVDAQLAARKVLLASLADTMPLSAGEDPAVMQAFVERHQVARKEFLNLHIFTRSGTLLNTQGDHAAAALALNPRSLAFLENALAAGKTVISPPYKSVLTGLPSIMILQPVRDQQGRTAMLLGGSIDLTNAVFLEQLSEQKPGKTGFLFIMTKDGILLHHPNPKRLLEHINARPGYNRATEMALRGFEGWTEAVNKDGSEGIYSYKHLQQTGWIIGARFPVDEAFAPMIQMRKHAMLAAAIFAAIAGLMAWLAIQVLLKPLGRLHRNINDIRSGAADIGVLQLRRADEIGELSAAFHELMAERETSQKAIRDSESLISNILERAPDPFVSCENNGTVTKWNAAAERTFGYTHQEAIGRDIAELIVPPQQRDAHRSGMMYFALGGAGPMVNSRVRLTAIHKDGHEIPIELSIGALRHDGAYYATAFLRDITERVLYEQQIAASEKRLRTVADSIPALIAYIDRNLRYRFSNEHFRTLLGHDPRNMLGKTIFEVLGPEFAGSLAHHSEAALRGQRVHYEREGMHKGVMRQMMGDLVPDLGADGTVAGFYMLAVDITERKNAELQQAASEKRLKLLTDNLPVLIAYLDRERKFLFLNATFQHWFGIDPQPLMGRHLSEGIGADHYYTAEPHLDRAYRGEMVTYELRARVGDSQHTLETTFVPELGADGEVLGIYSLTHDTTRMKDIEEKLKQLARIDSLTGIANRLMFEEILQLAIVRARRNRKPVALAYLDIDHFKEVNDTSGHGAGDLVLKEFATRLIGNVRASDSVARLAGDEFVIVFEQVDNAEEAARLAAKIVDAMHPPFTLEGRPRRVTTSMGIALHEGDEESAAALLARADSALYAAKRNGRDGYVVAD